MSITIGLNAHRKPGWDFACDSYGKVRHSRKAIAARAMLNAFGGDVPDYLKADFAALETAVIAAEGGAA